VKRVVLAFGLLGAAQPALALKPDVNLSGTFAASLSWYEEHTGTLDTTDVDLENNGSNFRIGAAAEEQGIRAFAVYERGASNDQLGVEDVREFFGGVTGRIGTLVTGRKATEYRLSGQRLDPFYNTSAASFNGTFAAEGASFGLSNLTNGYTPNTVAYGSPSFGGVTVNAATFINNNSNNQGVGDEADFGLGIGYANSDWLGLEAGLQFLDLNGNVVSGAAAGASQALRLHASVGRKAWTVGVSVEAVDVELEEDPRTYAFLSGSVQLYETLRLAATAGAVRDTRDPVATAEGMGGSVGLFWNLTQHLETYAALRYVTLDNAAEQDSGTLATGMKFTFDVDL
jgi:predicted porin